MSRYGHALQGFRGGEDGDAVVFFEHEQIVIAGDDGLGVGGERASKDMIVVGSRETRGISAGSTSSMIST